MAFWNSTEILNINTGVTANDGSGDPVRDAFNKVDQNFSNISIQLGQVYQDWTNANILYNLNVTSANITTFFVANGTGTNATFSNTITAANLVATSGLYSQGTIYTGNIIPTAGGTFNLGSPTRPFANLYVQNTVSTTQINQSSDAGILKIHANAFVGDIQDTGILGNISSDYPGAGNTYTFFGHQYTTNNFIYKITDSDATKGNNIVVGGVYGNAQLGSLLLSNTTSSTSNITGALIVSGGVGVSGNINVAGNVYSGGYQTLTTNTPGLTNYSGSTIATLVVTGVNPSTSTSTGALVLSYGGLGVGGNITAGGSINSGSSISAAAGFYGPLTGTIITAAQPNITSVGTLSSLNVGSASATSIGVTNLTVSSVLNVTGASISGVNGISVNSISGATIGNVGSAHIGATGRFDTSVTTATLNAATIGNVNASIIGATGRFDTSVTTATLNAATIGNTGSALTGTIQTASQPNITSLGSLTGLTVNGIITAGTLGNIGASIIGATGRFDTSVTTNTLNAATIGNTGSTLTGTIQTASQPNITGVGTLTSGALGSGFTAIPNSILANSSVTISAGTGMSGGGTVALGGTVTLTNAGVTGLSSSGAGNLTVSASTGPITVALPATGPGATTTGSSTAIPVVTTDAYGRVAGITTAAVIAPAGTLTGSTLASGVTASSLTSVGTLTGLTVSGAIVPSSNVAINLGSTTNWWNTMYGNAIHALYADLAENYLGDASYETGTVLIFGGSQEVTTTITFADSRVAGVVSTDPAYIMNGGLTGDHVVPVALRGRVPCKVIGPVNKGDLLVTSADAGYAVSVGTDKSQGVAVFAKSLVTDLSSGIKVIEAVII